MRYIFFFIFIISSFPSFSQSTLAQRPEEQIFTKAFELYSKGEYAAARESFEDFLDFNIKGLQREDAMYYRALSALNLFHEDAEDLVLSFIDEYPYHPKTVRALYVLGNNYFREGNYNKAIAYYNKVDAEALSADERDEMRFKAGYANFSQRKFDAALEYFNQLKRHSKKYASASSYYAGFIEYEMGEYDQAYADLTRAEESEAYAAVVPYMIANVLYKQQRYEQLLKYIEQVEVRPNVTQKSDLALLKAEAYYYTGDYRKAATAYEQYAEAQRNNISADIAFRYGRSLYSANVYEKAIEPLKRAAVAQDSLSGHAAYLLGLSYLKMDRKNEALTAFDQAVRLNKNGPLAEESKLNYAKVSLDVGQTRQAITAFEQFLNTYPNSTFKREVSELLSQSYLSSNDYRLALDYLSQSQNLTPQMERVYQKAAYLQAVEYFNANRYDQAITFFKRSLEYPRDPLTEARARLWLAESYSIDRNYDQAIDQYLRVIGNRNQDLELLQQARYGLGYAYYNTNQYNKAMVNFKAYTTANNARNYPNYKDAMLRLADSYYATKAYNEAVASYNSVIALPGKSDQDYAQLQKGIVSGIAGNYDQAVNAFDQVINNFPNSRYYDDAIFQKAQLSLEEGRYEAAINGFSRLIQEKSSSRLIPYALVKRASAYYNQQKYEQAKNDYVAVINDYVTHPAARQVLLPLQEVLNVLNQGGQFEQYFARYKAAHPDKEGLEAVEYETAKNMYFNQNYDKAIQNLEAFLQEYPNDPRATEARFYLAESFFRKNMLQQALDNYQQLVNAKDFGQRNRVINRLADINFQLGNFGKAITYYEMLVELAANKKELYNALAGLMESNFLQGEYDKTMTYADQILERALVNAGAQNRALLFKGKAAKGKGQFETANQFFQQTIDNARDVNAAEAGYLMGEILYQQNKHDQSIDTLISFAKDFSTYEEWVGKAYLLIADNYIAKEDYFQAKGTLQSLIDNFPGEDIKEKARRKLQQVEQLQAQDLEQKASPDTLEIDIKDIDN